MRRKGLKTKVMAAVLSASMAMSVCPATAFAAPEEGEAVVEEEAVDAGAEDAEEETTKAAEDAAAEEEADAGKAIEEKEKKNLLKRRSIDSRLTREKSSFNFREISEVTTDSEEIIPVMI